MNLKQLATIFLGQSIGSTLVPNSFKEMWKKEISIYIEKDFGENEYINGPSFTITDIYLGLTLAHFYHAGILDLAPKKVQEYYTKKIATRPAFKKSIEGTLFNFGL